MAHKQLRTDPSEAGLTRARQAMVEHQIKARGVTDKGVLSAMAAVPRHRFVPPSELADAYADRPLPLGHEQTISQPYIVGLMTSLLEVGPGDRLLEVGTGCGYQTAVLCALGAEVHSIEIVPALAEQARHTLADLGFSAHLHVGDGAFGLPEVAPFLGILLAAAPEEIPSALFDQLADGGRLVAPVGGTDQQLLVFQREGERFEVERVADVRFVPMTGTSQRQ